MAASSTFLFHLPRSPTASPLFYSAVSSSSLLRVRSLPLASSPPPPQPRFRPFVSGSDGRLFSSSTVSIPSSLSPPSPFLSSSRECVSHGLNDDDKEEEEAEDLDLQAGVGQESQRNEGVEENATAAEAEPLPRLPSPELSIKEKKELASYAHSLGKKLKTQQVGKSGVTAAVAASFVENLESNELLKIKIHGNCPSELIDAIQQLEQSTGSVAVAQIGRSVILYRPSISKTKKKQAQSPPRKTSNANASKPTGPLDLNRKRYSHARGGL